MTGFARLGTQGERPPHEWLAEVDPAARAPADRPFVLLNMVASADGRAALEGRTRALGSDADTLLLTELRALADAVLIGVGTLRAEGYARLVAEPGRVARRVAAGRPERRSPCCCRAPSRSRGTPGCSPPPISPC